MVATLTYRNNDAGVSPIESVILTYRDVQIYLKALRNDGYKVRFFCVGEYGSLKGRAHWHVILHFQGKSLEYPLKENVTCKYWRHGFALYDESSEDTIRYVCKYLVKKDVEKGEQLKVRLSRLPPLGREYFRDLAKRHVKYGLAPQDLKYWFNGVVDYKSGLPTQFMLKGASRDHYISDYIMEWQIQRGGFTPCSEVVDDYIDRHCGYSQPVVARRQSRRVDEPSSPAPPGAVIEWCDKMRHYYYDQGQYRMYWSFSDDGENGWHASIRSSTEATNLRAASAMRRAPAIYLKARDG